MCSSENKPNCKCTEGFKCNVTKTEPSKIGQPYAKCAGSGCTCVTETAVVQQQLEISAAAKAYCECGPGWSCVVSNDAGKTYFECGEGCICVIDESNNVKVVCA